VHLDAQEDIPGQARPNPLGRQLDHLRRLERSCGPHASRMSPGTNPPLPGLNVHRQILCNDFFATSTTHYGGSDWQSETRFLKSAVNDIFEEIL
jgi:hypothetical protein